MRAADFVNPLVLSALVNVSQRKIRRTLCVEAASQIV